MSGLFSIGAVVGPHLFFRHPWSGIGNSLSAGVGSSDFLEIGGIANTDIILDEAHTDPGSRWSLMTFADIQLYRKDKANRINYGIGPGLTLHFKDLVFLTSIGPFIEGYESHSAVRTGAYVMQKIFHRWSDQRDIFFTIKASQTRWFTWSTGAGIIFKYGAGPKREGYSVEALYEENKALQSSIIIVKAGLLF